MISAYGAPGRARNLCNMANLKEKLIQSLQDDNAAALDTLISAGEVAAGTRVAITAEVLLKSPRFRECTGPTKGRCWIVMQYETEQYGLLQAAIRMGAKSCLALLLRRLRDCASCVVDDELPLQPKTALQEAAYQHDIASFMAIVDAGLQAVGPCELTMLFAGLYPPWHEYGVKSGTAESRAILTLTSMLMGQLVPPGQEISRPFDPELVTAVRLAAASVPSALRMILDALDVASPFAGQHLIMQSMDEDENHVVTAAVETGCVEGADACIRRSIVLGDDGTWLLQGHNLAAYHWPSYSDAECVSGCGFDAIRVPPSCGEVVQTAVRATRMCCDPSAASCCYSAASQLEAFGRPCCGPVPIVELRKLLSLQSLRLMNHGFQRLGYGHCDEASGRTIIDYSAQPLGDKEVASASNHLYPECPEPIWDAIASPSALQLLLEMGAPPDGRSPELERRSPLEVFLSDTGKAGFPLEHVTAVVRLLLNAGASLYRHR